MLAALLAVAGPARADVEARASFDPFDLAEGRIPVWPADSDVAASGPVSVAVEREDAPGQWTAVGAPCTLALDAGALVAPGDAICPSLWAMMPLVPIRLAFELEDEAGDPVPVTVTLEPRAAKAGDGAAQVDESLYLKLPERARNRELAVLEHRGTEALPEPVRWVKRRYTDRVQVGEAGRGAARRGRYRLYAHDGDDLVAWRTEGASEPAAGGPPEAARAPSAPAGPAMTCPPKGKEFRDHVIVCARPVGGTVELIPYNVRGQVIRPNTPMLVIVEHQRRQRASVSLSGVAGTSVPAVKVVDPSVVKQFAGFFIEGDEEADGPELRPTVVRFAPRRPGETARLMVGIIGRNGELVASNEMEFVVDVTYGGSMKLGVAAVFGAVDHSYRAARVGTSAQAEVVEVPRSVVDADLVLGFTPYLERGGRPASGCPNKLKCFSPYVGIGIVGTKQKGFDVFKSFHLGVEWELAPSFGIGASAVLRRVEDLRSGYRIGSPVEEDVPTDTRWAVGGGVFINLSPEFIKVATAGAGGE